MRKTREQLEQENQRYCAENTLLIQYASDVENNVLPATVEREGTGLDRIEGHLYRPCAGHGGIAVMKYRTAEKKWDVHIQSLEDLERDLRGNYSEHTVNLRIIVEKLVRARNRALDTKEHAIVAGTL